MTYIKTFKGTKITQCGATVLSIVQVTVLSSKSDFNVFILE